MQKMEKYGMNLSLVNLLYDNPSKDLSEKDYYPFGMVMPERNFSYENYRFGFIGEEIDNELKGNGNSLDFGERMYDPRVGRWLSLDPLVRAYPSMSDFIYATNSPIRVVDVGGKDIYILFYTSGHGGPGGATDDAMFKAAAYTRQYDIEHSTFFNGETDKVVVFEISDISKIASLTESTVAQLSGTYGKTAEFGIWSHSALDGPAGPENASLDPVDRKQMGMTGWGSIEFYWNEDATAAFYGCNTGVSTNDKESFSSRISSLKNFSDVNILGQDGFSYPSLYTDYKDNGGKNSPEDSSFEKPLFENFTRNSTLDNFPSLSTWIATGKKIDKTYFVASPKHRSGDVVIPMTLSRNGVQVGTKDQPGDKK